MPISDNPKLDAVNIMLSSIGEQPVNSLQSGLVDAEMAETILDAQTKDVQTAGWNFNTDYNRKFTPNATTGEVDLPINTLALDTVGQSYTTRLVQRGLKLYDPVKHTYDILANHSEVYLDIVLELGFNEDSEKKNALPEYARRYIATKSARIFQSRVVGSDDLHAFTKEDEFDAFMNLKRTDAMNQDSTIFDNYDVYRAIHRGYPNLGSGSLRYATFS